jgi:Aldehyde dehydrogenase family
VASSLSLGRVVALVNNSMQIAREEIFGPVAATIPFKDENDAIWADALFPVARSRVAIRPIEKLQTRLYEAGLFA